MATVHAMGSRKKAEGGVSLSGENADSARSWIYQAVDPILLPWLAQLNILSPWNKKILVSRDHFDDIDVISTILDSFEDTIKIDITTKFFLSLT